MSDELIEATRELLLGIQLDHMTRPGTMSEMVLELANAVDDLIYRHDVETLSRQPLDADEQRMHEEGRARMMESAAPRTWQVRP